MDNISADQLLETSAQSFWNEVEPGDHVVHIYDTENIFIDLLENFVVSGINANVCVVVIATQPHLKALETKMKIRGYDVFALTLSDQFIPLNAEDMLEKFMVNDWPDEALFEYNLSAIISRAKKHKRDVFAFSEMVGLLWSAGHSLATIKVEHLWSKLCNNNSLRLYCAYARDSFFHNENLINNICEGHSKMIVGFDKAKVKIQYKNVLK